LSQQINLLNTALEPQKKIFPASSMLWALLLIVISALCVLLYLDRKVASLAQQADAGKVTLTQREVQLSNLKQQFPPRLQSRELALQVDAMKASILALQGAAQALQQGDFGNTQGYSGYFSGFARLSVSGLWLTGLSISNSGKDIGIEGQTLRAELVPQFIRRLANDPVFQGKQFGSLEIVPVAASSADAAAALAQPVLAFKLQAASASAVDAQGGALK
jgi:hypothetical protein